MWHGVEGVHRGMVGMRHSGSARLSTLPSRCLLCRDLASWWALRTVQVLPQVANLRPFLYSTAM